MMPCLWNLQKITQSIFIVILFCHNKGVTNSMYSNSSEINMALV